jgi:hypothetical protein
MIFLDGGSTRAAVKDDSDHWDGEIVCRRRINVTGAQQTAQQKHIAATTMRKYVEQHSVGGVRASCMWRSRGKDR